MLRTVPLGESDLVVTLLTEARGVVAAVAHRARRGARLPVEPMHTLRVTLDERVGAELFRLRESRIETPRTRLLARLDGLEAAGKGLRWARGMLPPHVAEPHAWDAVLDLLNDLDADPPGPAAPALATAGLQLLESVGWGFELRACVRCGTVCPEGKAAQFDPAAGGLVCRDCGGARIVLSAADRRALEDARDAGLAIASEELARAAVSWVDAALAAHDVVAPRP